MLVYLSPISDGHPQVLTVKANNPWIGAPRIQVWGRSAQAGAAGNALMSGWSGEHEMGENSRVDTGNQNGAWGWKSECDRESDNSNQKVFNFYINAPPAACVNSQFGYTCPDDMDSTLTEICNFAAPVF